MNIIKEFEDHDFFCHPDVSGLTSEFRDKYTWYWGLGDNGRIYFRCTRFHDPDNWRDLSRDNEIAPLVCLKTMKKLVKQFGHLVVFI